MLRPGSLCIPKVQSALDPRCLIHACKQPQSLSAGPCTVVLRFHLTFCLTWALYRCFAEQVRDYEYNEERQQSQSDSTKNLKSDSESKRSQLEQWSSSAYGEVRPCTLDIDPHTWLCFSRCFVPAPVAGAALSIGLPHWLLCVRLFSGPKTTSMSAWYLLACLQQR